MESFKVLLSVAFLVACALAAQAIEPEEGPAPLAPGAVAPPPQPQGLVVPEGPSRTKKQALLPLGYAAYPYAAYPYYHSYPYAYSYSYYDDGKYWPGKYEKTIPYKTYPYPYYPYHSHYYY